MVKYCRAKRMCHCIPWPRNPYWRGRAQYSWPPCTN